MYLQLLGKVYHVLPVLHIGFCRGLVQSTSLFFTLGDWISREGLEDHHLGGRTN
jgi:hypothetical protein